MFAIWPKDKWKKICRKGRYVTDKTFNKSSYPKSFTYWFCTLGPLCMHQTTHIKWKILVRFRYALQNFEMEIGKYRYWFRRKCLCACTKLTKKPFRKAVNWRNQRISTFFYYFKTLCDVPRRVAITSKRRIWLVIHCKFMSKFFNMP